MIIGNGLLANHFKNVLLNKIKKIMKTITLLANHFKNVLLPANVVVFASGVSNSQETQKHEFEREYNLLTETLSKYPQYKVVYFSTLSTYSAVLQQTPYILHKKKIEKYLLAASSVHLAIRLPNVVGAGGNPNTLINFIMQRIKSQQEVVVWKYAKRNFLGIDDVVTLVVLLLKYKTTGIYDVYHPITYSLEEIIRIIEWFAGIQANKKQILKGDDYTPPFSTTLQLLFNQTSIDLSDGYLSSLLHRYYTV